MAEAVTSLSISYARNLLIINKTVEIVLGLLVIQFLASRSSNYTTCPSRRADAMVKSWNAIRDSDASKALSEDYT
jgi:hypothetical protein